MLYDPLGMWPGKPSWNMSDSHMFLRHLANHLFFPSFVSLLQNFVQIISNLLSEHNREKWEEAQLVWTFPKKTHRLTRGISKWLHDLLALVHNVLCATRICFYHRPQNIFIHHCCSLWINPCDERGRQLRHSHLWSTSVLTGNQVIHELVMWVILVPGWVIFMELTQWDTGSQFNAKVSAWRTMKNWCWITNFG